MSKITCINNLKKIFLKTIEQEIISYGFFISNINIINKSNLCYIYLGNINFNIISIIDCKIVNEKLTYIISNRFFLICSRECYNNNKNNILKSYINIRIVINIKLKKIIKIYGMIYDFTKQYISLFNNKIILSCKFCSIISIFKL